MKSFILVMTLFLSTSIFAAKPIQHETCDVKISPETLKLLKHNLEHIYNIEEKLLSRDFYIVPTSNDMGRASLTFNLKVQQTPLYKEVTRYNNFRKVVHTSEIDELKKYYRSIGSRLVVSSQRHVNHLYGYRYIVVHYKETTNEVSGAKCLYRAEILDEESRIMSRSLKEITQKGKNTNCMTSLEKGLNKLKIPKCKLNFVVNL